MRCLLLVLEYDGTDFAGFQVQPGQRTVQRELEIALGRVTGESIRINGAGRTDAGVHATGQVASLTTGSRLDVRTLSRALNASLPPDVAVRLAREVPEGFHARYSARSRRYVYRVWNSSVRTPIGRRYSYHWPRPLDLDPVAAAASGLIGTHDFASFAGSADQSRAGTTVRTVLRLEWGRRGDLVEVEVEANAFLPRMVRNIVGTLLLVGSGRLRVEQVRELLEARSRSAAGPTAPPEGLCLVGVTYPSAALGEEGDDAATWSGGVLGGVQGGAPNAAPMPNIDSQWRQDETPDDARSTR